MEYTISLTNKCNLRCTYCYERHLNTEYGHISDETADKIIKYINSRNDAKTIYLFGGEPLLYKDTIRKFCDNLKGDPFVITTNGTLLDEDFIKWCTDRKIIINMSHDGCKCAERGADRELLDKNLKLLLKYQPDALVQLVYTKDNLCDLYNNVMYLRSLGAKKVSAAMDSALVTDDIDAFGDEMRKQWKMLSEIKDMYIYELALKIRSIKEKKKSTCEICKKKVFINWDGKFYPCVQFQNRHEFVCGDVEKGMQAVAARVAHPDYSVMADRCKGCEIAQYCRNSCACRKMGTTESLSDISEAACMEEQVQILTALEIIANEHIQ